MTMKSDEGAIEGLSGVVPTADAGEHPLAVPQPPSPQGQPERPAPQPSSYARPPGNNPDTLGHGAMGFATILPKEVLGFGGLSLAAQSLGMSDWGAHPGLSVQSEDNWSGRAGAAAAPRGLQQRSARQSQGQQMAQISMHNAPLRQRDLEELLGELKSHIDGRLDEQNQQIMQLKAQQQETEAALMQDMQARRAREKKAFAYSGEPEGETAAESSDEETEAQEKDTPGSRVKGSVAAERARVTVQLPPHYWRMIEDLEQEDYEEGVLRRIHRTFCEMICSPKFDYSMGTVIIINVLFIGIQIDIAAQNQSQQLNNAEPEYFKRLETVFACIFLLECLARLVCWRLYFFCSGWNLFDMFIVISAIIEEYIKYFIASDSIAGKLSVLRFMRVAKLLRTLRIIRVVRTFRELRVVMNSIAASARSLFWTLTLLLVVVYFTSVLMLVELTNTAHAFHGASPADDTPHMVFRRTHFNSILTTLLTMFQTTTGGIMWEEASSALADSIQGVQVLWLLFISFVVFAIMNTVTGIFVDQAMKSASDDARNVALEERDKRARAMKQLRQLFKQADVGHKGQITREEMVRLIRNDRARTLFKRFDLDVRDLYAFFDQVAYQGKYISQRDVKTFITCAFRLKGMAKGMDVAALAFKNTIRGRSRD